MQDESTPYQSSLRGKRVFFSHDVGIVQLDRWCGDPQAALVAATHHQEILDSNKNISSSYGEVQTELLKLVQCCEDLQSAELDLTSIEETPELYELSKWVGEVQSKGLELLYNTKPRRSDTESEKEDDLNNSELRVLLELDHQYKGSIGLRRSRRTSKPLYRLNNWFGRELKLRVR